MNDEVRSSIALVRQAEWPVHRGKSNTFRKLMAEEARQQKRVIICANCEKRSPMVDGPAGEAWWQAHRCRPLRVIQGDAA